VGRSAVSRAAQNMAEMKDNGFSLTHDPIDLNRGRAKWHNRMLYGSLPGIGNGKTEKPASSADRKIVIDQSF
jgi:hypothetical protein